MNIDIKDQCAGRWASILVMVGFPSARLTGRHGPCHYCGGKDRARWVEEREVYFCGGCGVHKPMDIVMACLDLDYKQSVGYVRRVMNLSSTASVSGKKDPAILLNTVKRGLKKITADCPVGVYLKSRGIDVLPVAGCYWHASLNYYEAGNAMGKYAAMVTLFSTAERKRSTYHLTYLNPDGTLAPVSVGKKIMSPEHPFQGSSARLFPFDRVLGIAEGVETSLSIYQLLGMPVWCVGNANNMTKFVPPDTVAELYIFADEDSNGTGVVAAYRLFNRLRLLIDGGKAGGLVKVCVVRILHGHLYYDLGGSVDMNDFLVSMKALTVEEKKARIDPGTMAWLNGMESVFGEMASKSVVTSDGVTHVLK